MWIMWISAKKRKKTQAENVESDSEFGVKKRPPDMKS